MYANPPEFEFQGTIRKRKIISSLLIYVLCAIKQEIRHFHVVIIVQKWQRNVQKSVMHVQSCCFAY